MNEDILSCMVLRSPVVPWHSHECDLAFHGIQNYRIRTLARFFRLERGVVGIRGRTSRGAACSVLERANRQARGTAPAPVALE